MGVRKMGLEEELLLVDPQSGEMRNVAPAVLHSYRAAHGEPQDPEVEGELLRHMIETHSSPTADPDQAVEELRTARRTAIETAAQAGVAVAAVGFAPLPGEGTRVTPDSRYERIVAEFGATGRAAGSLGTHVHVDVADDEEGVRVLDGLRPWLPVLVAVAANSPYAEGSDTGYASWRQQVWSRWPSAGPAEPFGSVAEYRRVCRALVATGASLDEGMLYFDARLSAEFPTVEIRVGDVCTDLDDTVLVGVLARALVETLATGPADPAPRADLLRAAHWRAARYGLSGDLVHPVEGRLAPAVDVVDALVERVRPALQDAGDEQRVSDDLERLRAVGGGARRQRQAYERTGEVAAVVADLVARTATSAGLSPPAATHG